MAHAHVGPVHGRSTRSCVPLPAETLHATSLRRTCSFGSGSVHLLPDSRCRSDNVKMARTFLNENWLPKSVLCLARLRPAQISSRSDRWSHGGAGRAAAGHGVCHRFGTDAAGGDLLRHRHRISDFGAGRIEDADWRADRRLRGRRGGDRRGARRGRPVHVHGDGRRAAGHHGRSPGWARR